MYIFWRAHIKMDNIVFLNVALLIILHVDHIWYEIVYEGEILKPK